MYFGLICILSAIGIYLTKIEDIIYISFGLGIIGFVVILNEL